MNTPIGDTTFHLLEMYREVESSREQPRTPSKLSLSSANLMHDYEPLLYSYLYFSQVS